MAVKEKPILKMEQDDTLAKVMYDAYCTGVGGIAFNGDKLPSSDDFFADTAKEKQINGWRVAADAARAFIESI